MVPTIQAFTGYLQIYSNKIMNLIMASYNIIETLKFNNHIV